VTVPIGCAFTGQSSHRGRGWGSEAGAVGTLAWYAGGSIAATGRGRRLGFQTGHLPPDARPEGPGPRGMGRSALHRRPGRTEGLDGDDRSDDRRAVSVMPREERPRGSTSSPRTAATPRKAGTARAGRRIATMIRMHEPSRAHRQCPVPWAASRAADSSLPRSAVVERATSCAWSFGSSPAARATCLPVAARFA